jgi:hypothetical protein
VKNKICEFLKCLFRAISTLCLFLEIIKYFCESTKITLPCFTISSIIFTLTYFLIDGFFIKGYLKNKITIHINSNRNKINIFFGDLLSQKGWVAIPVNEFFDHLVDNNHVARASLHGRVIGKYWGDNPEKWHNDVLDDLKGCKCEKIEIKRESGNRYKYKIGTTAKILLEKKKFLFFVLSHTNTTTLEAKASVDDLQNALRNLLKRARSSCAEETLNIPLIGGGLSRTGLSNYMLINITLLIIKEVSKSGDITKEINIILDKKLKTLINLKTVLDTWR